VEQACLVDVFPPNPDLRIVPAALGDRAGAIGAAFLAAERISTGTVSK
jgi:hypothetical protein